MMFWDSSAVVPLLVDGASTDALFGMLRHDPTMLVWWATPVECTSAIARRERDGDLSATEAPDALERLAVLGSAWQEVTPSVAVRSLAQRLLRERQLRAADALQLAAAIEASENGDRAKSGVSALHLLGRSARRFRS